MKPRRGPNRKTAPAYNPAKGKRTSLSNWRKMAIDWGVYGIPESYLVGPDGTILYKRVGPFDDKSLKNGLYPAIEKALGTPAQAG